MKNLNITFSEEEFEDLKKRKVEMALKLKKVVSWERFVMEMCLR